MNLSRRNFIQSLLAAIYTPAIRPTDIYDFSPLPTPKHNPILIPKELKVSFDAWQLGSTVFSDWELNEDGLFVNRSAIADNITALSRRECTPIRISKVFFQDPKILWLQHAIDLKQPLILNPWENRQNIFAARELSFQPEPFTDLREQAEEERIAAKKAFEEYDWNTYWLDWESRAKKEHDYKKWVEEAPLRKQQEIKERWERVKNDSRKIYPIPA